MAHAEASQSLDSLPRRTTPASARAVITDCERCGEGLMARPGDVRRCLCGRTELRNPVAGGLGPSVVLPPTHDHTEIRRRLDIVDNLWQGLTA